MPENTAAPDVDPVTYQLVIEEYGFDGHWFDSEPTTDLDKLLDDVRTALEAGCDRITVKRY